MVHCLFILGKNPAFALYLLATCYFVVVCGVLLPGLELQQIVPVSPFRLLENYLLVVTVSK